MAAGKLSSPDVAPASSPSQRIALALRGKGCTYPGCQAPPVWCDGHHIRHWADGGTTDLPDIALLCRHHHTVVHRQGHLVDDHGVHWRRSDGSPVGNAPRIGWITRRE
ncbi:HNH endonuclease signature motif containing protein [Mobilicoccus pelagius]|uniref:HNH endonuclease signature motif containing protein n=1 Tax=Mobilicoccus pelagius TaxID=746032 RepID=UPI0002EF816B|nr:HNH endonuclease signature motif containing protein [Mobilicoccus pelagius]